MEIFSGGRPAGPASEAPIPYLYYSRNRNPVKKLIFLFSRLRRICPRTAARRIESFPPPETRGVDAPLRTLKIFHAKGNSVLDALLELSNGHALQGLKKLLEDFRREQNG